MTLLHPTVLDNFQCATRPPQNKKDPGPAAQMSGWPSWSDWMPATMHQASCPALWLRDRRPPDKERTRKGHMPHAKPLPAVWHWQLRQRWIRLPGAHDPCAVHPAHLHGNAAELQLQQQLVALQSVRQLSTVYCLMRCPLMHIKPPSRACCHAQPAVLASAAICSSVNPSACPGDCSLKTALSIMDRLHASPALSPECPEAATAAAAAWILGGCQT